MIAAHELAPYVLSIPRVGPGVAAAFLAYLGDRKSLASPAQVANFIGLAPRLDCFGRRDESIQAHNERRLLCNAKYHPTRGLVIPSLQRVRESERKVCPS